MAREYNDLVSVIVPVYNVEMYLRKCIDSIINQTYKNIEIILIDDGSADNSSSICDEYLMKYDKIRVVHKKNGGLSDARNYGIDIAKGEYISFVDSDDFIDSKMIEKLLYACKTYNKDIAVCGRYEIKNSVMTQKYTLDNIKVYDDRETMKVFFEGKEFDMAAWDKLYHKNLFKDIRYPFGKIHEDVLATPLLLSSSNGIIHVGEPLYYYQLRENSITTKPFRKNSLDLFDNALVMKSEMIALWPELKNNILEYYCRLTYNCVKRLIRCKKEKEYFNHYRYMKKQLIKYWYIILFSKCFNIKLKIGMFAVIFNMYSFIYKLKNIFCLF